MAAALGLAPPRTGLAKLALLPASPTPRFGTASRHVACSASLSSEPKQALGQLYGIASRAPQRRLCTHAVPGGGATLGLPPGDDGGEYARASAVAAKRGPGTLHAAEVGSLSRRMADADAPNALQARSLVLALSRSALPGARAGHTAALQARSLLHMLSFSASRCLPLGRQSSPSGHNLLSACGGRGVQCCVWQARAQLRAALPAEVLRVSGVSFEGRQALVAALQPGVPSRPPPHVA